MRTGRSSSTFVASASWRARSAGPKQKSMARPPITKDGRTMTG